MVKIKAVHEVIQEIVPRYIQRAEDKKKGKVDLIPESEHKLVYDSPTETLEPIYFFILDLMNDFGLKPEKLVDNFVSSPGSQHFGEMGQRASIMQQQGAKLLADINTVLRSILNLIYDLREFQIRLQSYKDLEDSNKKEAALLSLKQIWMDKVDIQKGNSSIKAMALGQGQFVTLIDAFLVAKDEQSVDKLDLNDIVKRILKPRIHEFNIWLNNSKGELEKRYNIEKTYLKSQVNSLKIYSRWAKPYMKAAQDLEMSDSGRNPALVKMFNSMLLELTLLGKRKISGDYPLKYVPKRDYYICTLLDFNFRGIPNRTQQGYVVGGRAEISFRSYVMNDDELAKLNQELEGSDLNNALTLIEGSTTESLGNLQEDIDYFLKEDEKKEEQTVKKDINPFMALFGTYEKKSKKDEKKENKDEKKKIEKIEKDSWIEKDYFRKPGVIEAKETTFSLFEIYKKAHGMAAFPTGFLGKD